MSKSKSSQDLINLYEAMDGSGKKSLSDFADFLYAQAAPASKEILPPDNVPRPQQETVVGAIKRLKVTYYMIDNMSVFSDASSLMTDNMVKGRDVVEVINEMEILFENAYKKLAQKGANNLDSGNS